MVAKTLALVATLLLITAQASSNASIVDAIPKVVPAGEKVDQAPLAKVLGDDKPEVVQVDDTKDDEADKADDAAPLPKFLSAPISPSEDSTGSGETVEMTTAAMEAAMTDLMLGKSAFGATPMGGSVKKIENLLVKVMQPKVIAAHKVDQATLNRLANEVKKCGSTKDAALKVAKAPFNDYNKMSRSHKSCRGQEATAYSSKMTCLTAQRSDYRTKVLKCNFFATVGRNYGTTKANVAVVRKAGGEATETYIVRISNTICGKHIHGSKGQKKAKGGWGGGLPGSMLDKYLRAKDACEQAKKKYAARVAECKRKTHAYSVKKGKCNQYQGLMDASSCKRAVIVKDACESYAGCYYAKVASYRVAEKNVRSEEIDRKAEWRGLRRLECLIKAFADGKVSNKEVDACKGNSYKPESTKHLTIKYPTIPPLKKCTLPVLYPATGAYKRREFAPLPVLAKGMASAPCSGMVTIPTKPRPGSPKAANCKRIALNGYYSAGGLLKCTNGHDVRRSFDKNSCPLGTKIFAPATRGDWKTFLASAGPLRNPHWIIDVTRPANSCGGCRSHAMNSKNRHQKTWVTSDGSPWWLRSSRYSEPNGDYHANCFLDLWHTPKNENSVTFNDGNCNYHSKSYYCQPVNLRLKPMKGSPASCRCSKVDLSGTYTAGVLVKCAQCLTVYKSTQKNSCPEGMKIFSPQSRQDWKTFLNSAGPLRAPHWIIDVTRPQNGCGGCTKFSMKSTTAQQATWRTSDGSPWWLRSTTYGQPDGDYKANCFLDLWHKPASADTVTFNDHNCNYRSRSYYCQPTRQNHNYAWKGAKAKPIVKKVYGNCKLSQHNGVGGCFAGAGSKKARALAACESVYGMGQCVDRACGSCNNRGYHGKAVPSPCNGATMWNYRDTSPKLSCGWQKCAEVIITSDGGKTWKPSCKNHKFDIRPSSKRPLCRNDNCVPKKFDMGRFKGVQLNLKESTLTAAGWKLWSNHGYKHHTTRGEIAPNKGDCIMWGSKVNNAQTKFHVAAIGRRNKINGQRGPVLENGVYWYTRYPQSNGFGMTSQLKLNSADMSDSGGAQYRLSWHLHRGSNVGGWRSGATKWLNSNNIFRKIVMYGPCAMGR